jgi:hypothetical protein
MTNAEMHLRAGRGIATLGQRLKFLGQEHRERIKRLKKLQDHLQEHEMKHPNQPDLIAAPPSIAPEVLELVEDPLGGL